MRWGNPDPSELGRAGEELAARWLVRRGWRILARRQPTPMAEIDLVAVRDLQLVCVEVKTGRVPAGVDRGQGHWRPADRFSARSLERHRRAGAYLARAWGRGDLRGGRVDLIEVLIESGRWPPRILHFPHLEEPI